MNEYHCYEVAVVAFSGSSQSVLEWGGRLRTYNEGVDVEVNHELIQKLDLDYKRTFSRMETMDWGYLFWNTANPSHYDANHAWILSSPINGKTVIDEVTQFYGSKGIVPRFYIYDLDQKLRFIQELEKHEFKIETFVDPIQLWTGELVAVKENHDVKIEEVTTENFEDAAQVEFSIPEFGGREVRRKAFEEEFRSSRFNHYLLRYHDEPIATACIFESGGDARMESVATLKEFRGRGFIKQLIRHIQRETQRLGHKHLWVFPIDEEIEQVYRKCGFRTVGRLTNGHAYMSGRGIHEIRQAARNE